MKTSPCLAILLPVCLAGLAGCGPEDGNVSLTEAPPFTEAESSRSLEFSGRMWDVKTSLPSTSGPGPNYFSNSEEAVWLDADGALHLTIRPVNGAWVGSEVVAQEALGYGRYTFTLAAGTAGLDPNIVVGLFTWDVEETEANREIDVELSRWGDPDNDNAQYVVQPFQTEGNRHRFDLATATDGTTQAFTWAAGQVDFSSSVDGAAVQEWIYTGSDVPSAGNAQARINFWLVNGDPPQNGEAAELVVRTFAFNP